MDKDTCIEVLIVGVGNGTRGDDGVGHFIARELERLCLPGTRVECYNGDGITLFTHWKKGDIVIILDAVRAGESPGKIYRFEMPGQSIPFQIFSDFSTHQSGIRETIELAGALDQLPFRLIVYGVEGRCFEMGSGLSGEVRRAAAEVVEMVKKDVRINVGKGWLRR
ncbi:MAG: hydrogenase maturation protease [Deltaproteobacteria bacterium]|nr:hydrogenase maturation protease [Deltaproteobacteria bacterium]